MNGEIIRSSAEAGKVSNNKTIEFRLRVVLMILGVCLFLAVKEIYWPVIVSLIITFILTPLRDGIQKGHMKLHAKSLAILAGATNDNLDLVVDKLREQKHMNLAIAKQIVSELSN